MPPSPETEEERFHRLGREDHFNDVRKRYNIPANHVLSYGYKTSMNKQVLVDGKPLEEWYKNHTLKDTEMDSNKNKKLN